MNMGLDSPMEALAINYNQALFTAANATVWAWIAFLTTAAISFSWKIKKSSIIHSSSSSLPPNQDSSSSNDEPSLLQLVDDDDDDDLQPSTSTSIPPTPPAASLTSSTTFCWLENRRSGKFSLHYGQAHDQEYCLGTHQQQQHEQEEEVERLDDDEEHELIKGSSIMHKDDDGYYQLVLKMKTSDMGWYHYQDLSMLDGNVVRFWTQ